MRAEKPLKPKLNLSEFSINRWLFYNNYLVIGENNFAEFKSKNDKIAKKLFRKQFKEKILTIKKIKNYHNFFHYPLSHKQLIKIPKAAGLYCLAQRIQ